MYVCIYMHICRVFVLKYLYTPGLTEKNDEWYFKISNCIGPSSGKRRKIKCFEKNWTWKFRKRSHRLAWPSLPQEKPKFTRICWRKGTLTRRSAQHRTLVWYYSLILASLRPWSITWYYLSLPHSPSYQQRNLPSVSVCCLPSDNEFLCVRSNRFIELEVRRF